MKTRRIDETIDDYAARLGVTRTGAAVRHGFEIACVMLKLSDEKTAELWVEYKRRLVQDYLQRDADADMAEFGREVGAIGTAGTPIAEYLRIRSV